MNEQRHNSSPLAGRLEILGDIDLGPRTPPGVSYHHARALPNGEDVDVVLVKGPAALEAADAARRAFLVQSPRLARLIDIETVEDDDGHSFSYVVMERNTDPSLRDIMSCSILRPETIRSIVGEAALGLDSARRRGLRHQNLDARRVRVNLDSGRVSVVGIGIEAAVIAQAPVPASQAHSPGEGESASDPEHDSTSHHETSAGGSKATEGSSVASDSSLDVTALAAILFQGMTGVDPLSDDSAVNDDGQVLAPSSLVSRPIPEDLDLLTTLVLRGDSDAPATVREFVDDLRPWQSVPVTLEAWDPNSPSAPVPDEPYDQASDDYDDVCDVPTALMPRVSADSGGAVTKTGGAIGDAGASAATVAGATAAGATVIGAAALAGGVGAGGTAFAKTVSAASEAETDGDVRSADAGGTAIIGAADEAAENTDDAEDAHATNDDLHHGEIPDHGDEPGHEDIPGDVAADSVHDRAEQADQLTDDSVELSDDSEVHVEQSPTMQFTVGLLRDAERPRTGWPGAPTITPAHIAAAQDDADAEDDHTDGDFAPDDSATLHGGSAAAHGDDAALQGHDVATHGDNIAPHGDSVTAQSDFADVQAGTSAGGEGYEQDDSSVTFGDDDHTGQVHGTPEEQQDGAAEISESAADAHALVNDLALTSDRPASQYPVRLDINSDTDRTAPSTGASTGAAASTAALPQAAASARPFPISLPISSPPSMPSTPSAPPSQSAAGSSHSAPAHSDTDPQLDVRNAISPGQPTRKHQQPPDATVKLSALDVPAPAPAGPIVVPGRDRDWTASTNALSQSTGNVSVDSSPTTLIRDVMGVAMASDDADTYRLGPQDAKGKSDQTRWILLGALVLIVLALVLAITAITSVTRDRTALPAPTHSASAAPAPSGQTSPPANVTPSPTPTPTSAPPVIGNVSVVSQPSGAADYQDRAGNVTDDNPATEWRTKIYKNANFGRMKDGQGLLIALQNQSDVHAVTVTSPTPGGTVELRQVNADGSPGDVLVSQPLADGDTKLQPPNPVKAQQLMIWFPELPPDAGGYRVRISEVSVE
ncbi:protein kinase family protein [Devriesea agamarum]|uniref:hypothetical protein n=1 Tax=Devriesea agamarum TaxID=472569 RepID=UPI00071E3C86|nr:hypothetical protein [Devriesea agamarum]